MSGVPFQERKSALRGPLDLVTGCYPAFLFGGAPARDTLPVFHFHDVTAAHLEPYLRHLADNGYRTVTSEDLARLVRDGVHPGGRSVALCFDDAWRSVWTVAAPLLRRHGLRAITYAIAGRVPEADGVRPALDGAGPADEGPELATWPELRALAQGGVVDVQSHAWSHAMVFCDATPSGFVSPRTRLSPLGRPLLRDGTPPLFADSTMLGCPLFPRRSRLSDARRWLPAEGTVEACTAHVAAAADPDYFGRPDWQNALRAIVAQRGGRYETDGERRAAMFDELARSRETLARRLGTPVRQVCFPWGVCGALAEGLAAQAGYTSGVADRLFGRRFLRGAGHPFRIMRLKHEYIPALPGAGRRLAFFPRRRRREAEA